ncbi:MAG: autotransporter-associated beta strand repeat-containing protein, partial [Kiritimatiellaeota bacterium]|nr:autotransporter-associated beta strand repeat-containing protein [Kiritimatiellota bacterium]
EASTTLSAAPANVVRVRDGGTLDYWNLYRPANWTLSIDGGGRTFTRGGFGAGTINTWAGPVTLTGGEATFASGTENLLAFSDTYTGVISGPGKLVKAGSESGVTYLLGTNNTWAGGTRIDNGILYAVAPGALPGYATDTEVHNRGTLALRVADAAGANPGFALSEIRDLLNNPLTFRSANASLGFETAYEDLLYTDPYPHAGIRKLGPNTLTLTDLGPNLGPIGVYGGTLDLSAANSYIDDNTILIGESAPAADPPATLILGAGARLTTLDRGYQGSPQPMVIVGNTGRGTLHVSDDAFINGRVILGNSAAAAGAVYQTGGTVHNTGGEGNDGHIGNQGYGYYLLAGGLYDNKGYSQVARNSSSVGILHQTGGTFNYVGHTGEGGYNGCYGISRGGIGVVNVEGGEFNSRVTLWVCDQNEGGNAGYAEFTVSGDAEVSINGQISMGERDGGTVGMLNLNGGEVNAERVWRANRGGNQVYVNWGGGLFRATSVTPELFAGDILPDVLLHGGGAVIDIPDTGKSKIIYAPLCAPEKLGLISIPVATGGAGYLGSPFVRLTGGGGRGASAFARVEGGEVTEIVVTSPGTGYSSSPVATLVGGGAATAATLGSPILGVVPPGGLTKLGHGLLTLGAANTYTGPTEVREGTLLLKHEAALAPASGIAVTGGTLDLGGATLSNGAVTVTGGAILNGTLATHAINKDGPGTLALSAFTVPAPPPPPPSPLTPGLWEGMIRSSWDTGTLNPKTSLQLTTRAANGGPQASNATYADGAWAGNYHTWVYTGCIWNRTDEDVDWTFFGRFDDNMRLTIDNAYVLDNGNGEDRFATYRLTPGPHFFEARFGDGEGEVGPGPRDRPAWPATGPMSGLLVDYSGQPGATEDLWRFQILEDPGDGSLFTAEVPPLEDGPGLFESVIRQNWNTLDDGTPISRQTTLRAGSDGPVGPNTTYADGMWAGNNHTWIYKGYIWNRTAEDFVWTWSFTFDDNVMLKIDGVVIRDVILSEGVQIQPDVRIPPGPHEIEIRFGDGGGDVGPHGGFPSGLMYDPLNRGSWDPNDYTPLEDLGDGDLLTTSLDWAPAEEGGEPEPSLVRVNVSEGTLLLDHAPTPGLHEGRLDGQFNTADPNPMTAIEFTTTAANGWCDSGGEINGKHWPDNSTYVYTGYIWNRDPTNVTWTFAENFDDNVLLVIDGATVLHDTSWDTPTYGTITLTPGPHPFEARFGQGGGGAGGNIVPNPDNPDPERNRWDWPDKNVAFLIDYQGRDEGVFANYELLQDDGTGRLLTCTAADPLDPTLPYAALQVSLAPGATLDLGGRARQVGEITGDGAIANGALAAGTVISPGGDDAIGTLALDNVTFGPGVTYRLTTDGAASDCITSASALDLRGVTVVPATGDLPTASAYVIATAPAFTGLPALDGFPSKYKTMKRGTDLLLTSKFGTLLILR